MKKLLVLLIMLLASCSGPTEGIVTSKEHQPARTYVVFMPMTVGKITTMIPYTVYDDEDWVICLKEGDDDGCQYVTETTYESAKLGAYVNLEASIVEENNKKVRK